MSKQTAAAIPSAPLDQDTAEQFAAARSAIPQETQDVLNEQSQYGSIPQGVAAGALGLLRSGTFGLSDEYLKTTGLVSPETLQGLKEANPLSTTTGEALPYFAPFLGEVLGAGALGSAVKGAGMLWGPLGEATEAAANFATKAFGEGAAKKILGNAAKLALESEAANVGQNISEAALQNQDLSAETLRANAGSSLAIGALSSLGLSAAGMAAQKASSVAASALDRIGGSLKTMVSGSAEKAAAANPEVADLLQKPFEYGTSEQLARQYSVGNVSPEVRESIVKGITDDVIKAEDGIDKAIRPIKGQLLLPEIEKQLESVPAKPALEDAFRLRNLLDDAADKMRADPGKYAAQGLVSGVEEARDSLQKSLGNGLKKDAFDAFKAVDEARDYLSSKTKVFAGKNIDPNDAETIDYVKSLYGDLKDHINNENLYGEGATKRMEWADAHAQYSADAANLKKFFMTTLNTVGGKEAVIDPIKINTFMNQIAAQRASLKTSVLDDYLGSAKNLLGIADNLNADGRVALDNDGLRSLIGKFETANSNAALQLGSASRLRALANEPFVTGIVPEALNRIPGAKTMSAIAESLAGLAPDQTRAVRRLAFIEGISKRFLGGMGDAIKSIGERAEESALGRGSLKTGAERMAVSLMDHQIAGMPEQNHKNELAAYRAQTQHMASLLSNPESTHRMLSDGFSKASSAAPIVTQKAVNQQIQSMQFLMDKMPKDPLAGSEINPSKSSWQPGAQELSRWSRYMQAVQDPMSVIASIKNGNLTKEGAEVLQTLYPEINKIAEQMIIEHTSSLGDKKIPLATKQSLSLKFGTPIGSAFRSGYAQRLQKSFAPDKPVKSTGPAMTISSQYDPAGKSMRKH